jgi:hypothetical protein
MRALFESALNPPEWKCLFFVFSCLFLLNFLPDFYIKPAFSSFYSTVFSYFESYLKIIVICFCGALWGSGEPPNETRQELSMPMLQGAFQG